jgi:hypothetical protein
MRIGLDEKRGRQRACEANASQRRAVQRGREKSSYPRCSKRDESNGRADEMVKCVCGVDGAEPRNRPSCGEHGRCKGRIGGFSGGKRGNSRHLLAAA